MTVNTDRSGRVTAFENHGLRASNFRNDGHAAHIEQVRADGNRVIVDRQLRGERRVEMIRAGGVRVVSVGNEGYVERPVRPGFIARTYVMPGGIDVRVYRLHTYGSVHYYTYVPRVYYQPAFYAWAYRPWLAPVPYAWGWRRAPWFAYYRGYFVPEPVYPSAALWLTDYILAENLRTAYESDLATTAAAGRPDLFSQNTTTPLSPEVKRAIAEEVQQWLVEDRARVLSPGIGIAQAPDDIPPVLDPKQKIFVVANGMDLTGGGGQSCALTAGDIIERTTRTVTDDGKVAVAVMNSKNGDCPVDFTAAMDVSVLQDMYNRFRELGAAGLGTLSTSQGQDLPAAPPAEPRQLAEGQAPAAADARQLIVRQASEADETEAEVKLPTSGGL